MTQENQNRLTIAGIIAVGIWVVFLWPHTDVWDGDGTVSVFPKSEYSKNYRLDAQIEVTRHRNGWMYGSSDTEYNVTRFNWPDGGYADFKKCVVKNKDRSECKDQDSNTYVIEVTSPPEQPEADSSDN